MLALLMPKPSNDVLVTCLNQESNIGIHEPDSHRHVLAIWKDGTPVRSAFLDEAEDVVPSKSR